MVCDSCEKKGKLSQLATSRIKETSSSSSSSSSGGGIGGAIKGAGKSNKLLQKAKEQWIPKDSHCRICKQKTQLNYHYCNNCAHQKGICTMCGKKTVDVSKLKMSLH